MSEPKLVEKCPGCHKKLITLVSSTSITYSAPDGGCGDIIHTIEWCEFCGTVRQYNHNSISDKVMVKLPVFTLLPKINKEMLKHIDK